MDALKTSKLPTVSPSLKCMDSSLGRFLFFLFKNEFEVCPFGSNRTYTLRAS